MNPPMPHGGQLRLLARTWNLDPDSILDFSANINPEGPPASVLEALREHLADPAALVFYPDLELHDLRVAIARHLHTRGDDTGRPVISRSTPAGSLSSTNISVANGFVPLLEAAIRTHKLQHCLLPVPAFSEYRATLERCGTRITAYGLDLRDFTYDVHELARLLQQTGADSILLANPQNPSGVLTSSSVLLSLAQQYPRVQVLVDEAFIDYAPRQSLCAFAPRLPNLTVFRSVTKFFAMPALRIAYTVTSATAQQALQHFLPPWPVSTLATVAVAAALADDLFTADTLKRNQQRRDLLRASLAEMGIACPPPAANFLLLRTPVAAAKLWQKLLIDHAILLRRCDNFEALGPDYLRTGVRGELDNARLCVALRNCLASLKG